MTDAPCPSRKNAGAILPRTSVRKAAILAFAMTRPTCGDAILNTTRRNGADVKVFLTPRLREATEYILVLANNYCGENHGDREDDFYVMLSDPRYQQLRMISMFLLTSTAALLVWVIYQFIDECLVRWRLPPGSKLPPMPPAKSIRGHVEIMRQDFFHKKCLEWAKEYGPVIRNQIEEYKRRMWGHETKDFVLGYAERIEESKHASRPPFTAAPTLKTPGVRARATSASGNNGMLQVEAETRVRAYNVTKLQPGPPALPGTVDCFTLRLKLESELVMSPDWGKTQRSLLS
ncbi:hypothetical protein HPB50_018715 [Hyalomma asiaticum]|uniref:Uncharacterized protein n=1 Tax=Hyalomma asiaticum TaxID=266040 RepID=A0ACB7RVC7_HYAAI|nr:hypothetical protein HPB50_018715 [Hyalomma asiaticum]